MCVCVCVCVARVSVEGECVNISMSVISVCVGPNLMPATGEQVEREG